MITNWFHRFLNPHCPDCKEEVEISRICESCETLKQQLAFANINNEKLMARLLAEPKVEVPSQPMEVTIPRNIPWNVRRQMLEAEDREKAKLLKTAPVPVEELEKELDIATAEREKAR